MPYKKTAISPITAATTEANAQRWLNIIKYSESATIIQLQDDCEYRATEIIQNPRLLKKYLGPYYRKYILLYIEVSEDHILQLIVKALSKAASRRNIKIPESILSARQICHYLVKKGYEIGIFVGKSNPIFTQNPNALIALEKLLEETSHCSIIIFTELDITTKTYHKLVNSNSLLFDHIIKYPLYQKVDCLQFIQYQNSMWNMQLTKKTVNQIIHQSGGYLWLISHLQRYFRDNTNSDFSHALDDRSLLIKLTVIWNKFSPEEQQLLSDITNNQPINTTTHEYNHLSDIGVIKNIDDKPALGIPLLRKTITHEKNLEQIKLRRGQIILDNQDITSQFSPYEYNLFTILIRHKQHIITREAAARAIWGDEWEEKYSDWALDRLAYRLRHTLKQVSVNPTIFRTIKRKGFKLG